MVVLDHVCCFCGEDAHISISYLMQPDTYEQSPTATTMVLSGVMVKMGVFGVLRWLVPIVPVGAWAWGDTVSTLAIVGMIYASLIAMRQDDLKRLIAYSSIAHVGLMCLTIFATMTAQVCRGDDTDVQSWCEYYRFVDCG